MDSKSVEDMIEGSSGFHFSGFHMDGSKLNNIEKPTTTLAIENGHKQPFIIGKFEHCNCYYSCHLLDAIMIKSSWCG